MSPRPRPGVVAAATGSAVRTREPYVLVEPEHDLDLALFEAHIDVLNEPRGLDAKELRVEVSVAHPQRSCTRAAVRGQRDAYAAVRHRFLDFSKLWHPLEILKPRNLDALACLEEIGGRLTIEETALRDLSGLEGLVSAESLLILRISELTTTKGLGLEQLLGEIDELSGLNSSLSEIVGNHQLTEVRFDALRELGTIGIGRCGPDETRVGNDALAALGEETFPVLESAVTLSISSNDALRSVEGLVDGLARRPSFMLVSILDNFELDGPGVREHWGNSGLDERFLLTCGNDGDPEACDCPVTE